MDLSAMMHYHSFAPPKTLKPYYFMLFLLVVGEVFFWKDIILAVPIEVDGLLVVALLFLFNGILLFVLSKWLDFEQLVQVMAESISGSLVGILLFLVIVFSIFALGIVPAIFLIIVLLFSIVSSNIISTNFGIDLLISQILGFSLVSFLLGGLIALIFHPVHRLIVGKPQDLSSVQVFLTDFQELGKRINFYDGRFYGLANGLVIDRKTSSILHNGAFGIVNIIFFDPFLLVHTGRSQLFLWEHANGWAFHGVVVHEGGSFTVKRKRVFTGLFKMKLVDGHLFLVIRNNRYLTSGISKEMHAEKLDSSVKAVANYGDQLVLLKELKKAGALASLRSGKITVEIGNRRLQLAENISYPNDIEFRGDSFVIVGSNGVFLYHFDESDVNFVKKLVGGIDAVYQIIPNDFNDRYLFVRTQRNLISLVDFHISGNLIEYELPVGFRIHSCYNGYLNISIWKHAFMLPYKHMDSFLSQL